MLILTISHCSHLTVDIMLILYNGIEMVNLMAPGTMMFTVQLG
jgi:hypothetical protein